jgi:two-component sensor histidine kinase
MINDILDLAKIEAGKVDLAIEPVAVARVFDNLKRRFEPVAAEKNLSLHFDVESGAPETIESDPLRLQQILTNLLSNALKFTEKGSVRLRVAAMDGPRVSFTVEDTGIGIPAEHQEIIFEAFRQADGTTIRKYGGTGLGLSICRELVSLLGGSIQLRSAPGEGSLFSVVLPLRSEPIAVGAPSDRKIVPKARAEGSPDIAAPLVADDRDRIADPHRHLGLLLNPHPAQRIRTPGFRVLQEVARCCDSCRAMHQCQRPRGDVRHDPLGDTFVISSELDLRNP